MILTYIEHGGPQIKFMEELRYKYVYLQDIGDILFLDIAQYIDKPFEMLMRGTNPEEIDLLTSDTGVSVGAGAEHQIIEDGSVRSDTDTTANHNSHLELVPVLIAAAEGSFNADLWLVLRIIIAGVKVIAQLPGPWALRLNMAT